MPRYDMSNKQNKTATTTNIDLSAKLYGLMFTLGLELTNVSAVSNVTLSQ